MRRLLVTLASAAVLAGCGSSSHATAPRTGCHAVSVPRAKGPQHLRAPSRPLSAGQSYTVTVQTNCGRFAFALDVKDSPRTAASFVALVRRGFFDGLTFQRVATGFVIQGGDPLGNGTGGPGYTVVEPPPAGYRYAVGDVAMAKTGTDPAGASGSQFFIVTGGASNLTPDYALLGRVTSGMGVVQAIGRLPTDQPGDGAPTPAVVMSRVTAG